MDSGKPIQIVSKNNHLFHLELEEIAPIFNSEKLKDRLVVIVSIADDLRKGKSFLLNFFLKYLNAKVKIVDTKNVIKWKISSAALSFIEN